MNVSPAASLADDLTNNNTMDCDDGFIAKPLHAFSGILRRANSCAVPSSFETSFDMNIFCTTNNEKQSVDIKQESFLSRFVSSLPPTQEQNDDDLLQTSSATNTTTEETTMMLMTPNEVCHYETDMKNILKEIFSHGAKQVQKFWYFRLQMLLQIFWCRGLVESNFKNFKK